METRAATTERQGWNEDRRSMGGAEEEPAKRQGSGTRSYGMKGKGRALVPKLSNSSHHHTVFSVSYNSDELYLG